MAKLLALAFLLAFVTWGATTAPGRPFSWAMYSGSSKAFLWTDTEDRPRVPSFEEMRLAPDSHYLLVRDFHQLFEDASASVPVQGLVISSRGSWLVEYAGDGRPPRSAPVPDGQELGFLAAALRRYECP